MLLTVKEIINETEDAVSIVLNKGGFFNPVKYKAGQFLIVKILVKNKIQKRAYSFSSSPVKDKFLRITVKKVEKGLVSNYLCDSLKVGDKLEIEKPAGSFFVVPDKKVKSTYVLFAGGSGITPIFSIIRTVLDKEPLSKILLIYANRNKASIIFKDEIEKLETVYPTAFSVEHLLEKTQEDKANYHQDLLHEDLIAEIFQKHQITYDNHSYMMCGPAGFMEKAKEILAKNGVSREKIKLEAFTTDVISSDEAKDLISTLTIYQEDKKLTLDVPGDKTILQTAMKNNIILPYSCRAGMCSSCKARCISGKIHMTDGHFLSEEEVAQGNILTCISYPKSDTVSISFLND
ncbi:phenylacetate-CoA oxygenase/reductase subunit PaaK [Aquimarina addita]|uniref:Phenylacetate-CoA oxygenase/reductase subunit PaaK n=1 Tax=Aquimarina addita TaxID=870485 RepID=A0ABP6UKY5_9FLAO